MDDFRQRMNQHNPPVSLATLSQPDTTPLLDTEPIRADRVNTWGFLQDVAAAPVRGAEGLFRGAIGFADWVLMDALPDSWKERRLGRSETLVGGLVEGITHYGLGFALAGKAFAAKTIAGTGVGKLAATSASHLGAGKKASLAIAGHSALKGAMADFVFMDPHEDRLSNLLNQYELLGPVSEFLAADEGDSEALGRFKNTLEGLGMSAATETLGIISRVLRRRNLDGTVKMLPKDAVEIQGAIENAISAQGVRDAFKSLDKESLNKAAEAFRMGADGNIRGRKEIATALKEAGVDPDRLRRTKKVVPEGGREAATREVSVNNKTYEVSPARMKEIEQALGNVDSEISVAITEAMAPVRKYLDDALVALKEAPGITEGRPIGTQNAEVISRQLNETFHNSMDNLVEFMDARGLDQDRMFAVLDQVAFEYRSLVKSHNFESLFNSPAYLRKLNDYAREITGKTIDQQVAGAREKAAAIGDRMSEAILDTAVMKEASDSLARKFYRDLEAAFEQILMGAGDSDRLLRQVEADSARLFDVLQAQSDTRYWMGLGLRSTAMDPSRIRMYASAGPNASGFTGDSPGSNAVFKHVVKALGIDKKPTRASLQKIKNLAENPRAIDALEQAIKASGGAGADAGVFLTVYRSALLSNPATNIFNAASTISRHLLEDTSRMMGAKIAKLMATTPEQKVIYQQMFESTRVGLEAYWNSRSEAVTAFKRAWNNRGKGELIQHSGSRMDNFSGPQRYDPFEVRRMLEEPEATGNAFQRIFQSIESGLDRLHDNVMPIIATPGRLMGATDEGLKVASFNSVVARQYHLEGARKGLSGRELSAFVNDGLRMSKVGGAQAVGEGAFMEQATRAVQLELKGIDSETIEPALFARKVRERYDQLSPTRQAELKYARNTALEASGKLEGELTAQQIFEADMKAVEFLYQTSKDAVRAALEDAFQTPLTRDRSFSAGLAEVLARAETEGSTVQRFVLGASLPFIRTPYNVMSFIAEFASAPFRAANDATSSVMSYLRGSPKTSRDLFQYAEVIRAAKAGDIRAQAEAVEYFGRLAASTTAWGIGLGLYQSGMITGSAPRDPDERALMQSAGIPPNSILIGNTWVSYTKIAPLNTIFGLIADVGEAIVHGESHEGIVDQMGALSLSAVMALASNFTDKTFLTNFNAVLDNVINPDEAGLDRIISTIGTPLFAPQVVQAFTRNIMDGDSIRETGNMANMVLGRTPGSHRGIDLRRNALGEQVPRNARGPGLLAMVNPLYLSAKPETDRVLAEILTLNEPLRKPSPVVADGTLDMRDFTVENPELGGERSLHDRRLELMSTMELQGRTLRQALEKLMNDPRYQQLPRDGAFDGLNDPRTLVIRRVIEPYRQASMQQVLAENPAFLDRYNRHNMSAQAVQGGFSPVDARAMFGLR